MSPLAAKGWYALETMIDERQVRDLPRRVIAAASLEERGAAVVTRDLAEAVALADAFAPEHLALHARRAASLVPRISRAGAVFVGSSTPEAVGDYLAGPSHVLPTAGTARFASPLSVATFRRRMSVLDLSPRALAAVAVLAGFGFSAQWIFPWAMVADVGDYDRVDLRRIAVALTAEKVPVPGRRRTGGGEGWGQATLR